MAADPLDRIATICHDQPHDALTQIAEVLGFPEHPPTHPDTMLLDFLAAEYLDVLAFSMPTGAGDADVGWKLLQHHMGKKGVVEVACHYRDDLRAAIREAMLELGYIPPGASGVGVAPYQTFCTPHAGDSGKPQG